MTQYFYFWRMKDNPNSKWVAYSVTHNPKEVKIVEAMIEKSIAKTNGRIEYKKEKGVKPQCKN